MQWYQSWHNHSYHPHTHWAAFLQIPSWMRTFRSEYDLNQDGLINILDVLEVARRWG